MKNIKKIITLGLASLLLVPVLGLASGVVGAQASKDICDGVKFTGGDCSSTAGPSVDGTIKLAINVLSMIVGVTAVIMIMIGGFKYITSMGDASNISGAKNTILYAVVGLVVVAVAQIVVVFVLKKVDPGTAAPAVTCTAPAVLQSDGKTCL